MEQESNRFESRKQRVGRSITLGVILLLPLPFYILFASVLSMQTQFSEAFNNAQALALTGACCFLIVVAFCIVAAGEIAGSFRVMRIRVTELLCDLRDAPEHAWPIYCMNVRLYGAWFWLYLLIILYGSGWLILAGAHFLKLL